MRTMEYNVKEKLTSKYLDNNNHTLNPVFPTSSPWVTSVGGTYIFNITNRICNI